MFGWTLRLCPCSDTCLNPQGEPGEDGRPGEGGVVGNTVRFSTSISPCQHSWQDVRAAAQWGHVRLLRRVAYLTVATHVSIQVYAGSEITRVKGQSHLNILHFQLKTQVIDCYNDNNNNNTILLKAPFRTLHINKQSNHETIIIKNCQRKILNKSQQNV